MQASDAVQKLAQDLAGAGMVLKAVLIYDFIDNDGQRVLNFSVTDDMTVWDLDGMLSGVQIIASERYTKEG